VQLLQAPVVFDEVDRQPVEQLRMRRRFALQAKIFARANQARAEIRLPDAVDDRPRRGRTFLIDEPLREIQPRWILALQRVQKARRSRLDR
jgi:hypothetical protein